MIHLHESGTALLVFVKSRSLNFQLPGGNGIARLLGIYLRRQYLKTMHTEKL